MCSCWISYLHRSTHLQIQIAERLLTIYLSFALHLLACPYLWVIYSKLIAGSGSLLCTPNKSKMSLACCTGSTIDCSAPGFVCRACANTGDEAPPSRICLCLIPRSKYIVASSKLTMSQAVGLFLYLCYRTSWASSKCHAASFRHNSLWASRVFSLLSCLPTNAILRSNRILFNLILQHWLRLHHNNAIFLTSLQSLKFCMPSLNQYSAKSN